MLTEGTELPPETAGGAGPVRDGAELGGGAVLGRGGAGRYRRHRGLSEALLGAEAAWGVLFVNQVEQGASSSARGKGRIPKEG